MAINQTQVKNNVYKAIEVIAEQRIDSLKLDKTIIGTVENKISNGNNQYRIKYNGGTLYAYAQDDSVYLPNTTVYVLVPENDFNNKKWIVGRVSNTRVDQNIDVVGHALNEYSVIGNNAVYVADEELADAFKLQSYSVRQTGETYQDANVLYDAKQPEISVLGINVGDLETYVRQAQAISFAADFRTSLTKEQQRNVSGDYGLIFNVRFKNKNTSYPTMQDKWDALEPNTRTKIDMIPEPEYRGLSYYEQEIRDIITNQTQTTQQMQQAVDGVNQLMIDFIAKTAATFDGDTQSLVNQYAQLIDDILALTINNAGEPITPGDILAEYVGWFNGESDSYVEVVESYFLDVNNMVGNPYNLKEYAHQYITVPIEAERFVGIDAIYFYCDGFIQDYAKAEEWGYDLFVKDIEINCLEELDDINNEYRLTLDFPQGAIFRTNESADTRLVRAHIVYQNREDLTPFCTFSWFKQNSAVTPQSSKYNAMAGSGWERVSIDSITTEVEFAAVDNRAYENYYKVIGTYNLETILIKQFILYNEANKHDVELVCDSGFAFEFSDSTKTIVCEIDGESQPETYDYVWSVDGEALTITADRYKELIAELQHSPELTTEILKQISLYKNQLNKVEGLIWDNNTLQFPSSKMPANGEVHIRCSVRKDGYDIGAAEATLTQGNVITLKGYYIEIENGNQTFQYNEAGVSPASERYNEPIEILPLHCKFYSPSGNLINSLNYTVKWKVPLENTLIIVDRTKVDEEGINPYAICNFTISDDYNYSSLNNQILCIVEFNGDVYTETTDFYFGKIGENGTNGTDVVAKIVPIGEKTNSVLNNELLALNVYPDGTSRWNTGAAIDTAVLELQLFRRNDYIDPKDLQNGYKFIKWSMSGNTRAREMSVYPSAESNTYGAISYDIEASGRERFRNQIVKGQASLRVNDEYQAYNYFYPIPTIIWEEDTTPFSIGIDKTYTLRQVLYNADGRNPVYNKNQGAKLNLPENYHISWAAVGGIDETADTAALKIEETEDNYFVQVEPADVYSGEYTNNCIKAEVLNENDELQCTVYIPIHMSLNTYGLASLNAWDGNSIEIDEDQGYILAPQIGAGEKHVEDNTFTGVVMGVEKTYEGDRNVGLLGYSHGRQSIFLNAEDGSATFGLPDVMSDDNDSTEGRIKLVPGGRSNIGSWIFSNNYLYNIADNNNNIGDKYTDSNAKGHLVDMPHDKKGILLSSEPPYISIKGRVLTESDISSNANRVVNPGDSLEVQLDPEQQSLFTIFRHYKDKRGDWQRSATVGIDRQGRFYSNALRQESTSLAIGYVGAFGQIAAEEAYLGVSVDVNDDTTIWKMFAGYPYSEVMPQEGDIPIDNDWYEIDSKNHYVPTTDEEVVSGKTYYKKDPIAKDSPLYISGGSSENNDYERPIQIMGKELNLRSSANDDNSRINMTMTSLMLGQKNAKLNLNNTTGSLTTTGAFTRTIGGANTDSISGNSTITIGGALSETVAGNVSKTWANSYVQDSSTRFRVYGKTQGSITPYDLILSRNGTDNSYLSVNNHRFILQSNSSHGASSNAGGSIALEALNTNYGITLRSTPVSGSGTAYEAGLRILPSRGGNAFFNLYATGTAQVNSTNNIGYTFGAYTDNANRSYAASGSTGVSAFNNIGTHGIYVDRGARNVAFATTTIKGSKHGDYQYTSDGTSVWDLIYDCLNAAEDARNAARAAHDRANNAYNRADAAYDYADSAYDYAGDAMSRANSAYDVADNCPTDIWINSFEVGNSVTIGVGLNNGTSDSTVFSIGE